MLGDHSWLLTPSKSAFRVKEGKKFCFIKHHVWYFCEKKPFNIFYNVKYGTEKKQGQLLVALWLMLFLLFIHFLCMSTYVLHFSGQKKNLSNHCDHFHVNESFAHYSLVFPLLCSSCSTKSYTLAGCSSLSVYVTIIHKLLTFLLALKWLRRLRGNISPQEAGHFVLKSTWFLQSVAGMSNVM